MVKTKTVTRVLQKQISMTYLPVTIMWDHISQSWRFYPSLEWVIFRVISPRDIVPGKKDQKSSHELSSSNTEDFHAEVQVLIL